MPVFIFAVLFLIISLIILSFLHTRLWTKEWLRKNIVSFVISFLLIFILFILLFRVNNKIREFESNTNTQESLYEPDPKYGFKAIPNSETTLKVNSNLSYKLSYDENGFRYGSNCDSNKVLFVGCSFTYGDLVEAEESFPFLVGKRLNLCSINAGIRGGGLVQVLLQLEEAISSQKPGMIIFQWSPWLMDRSQNYLSPNLGTRLPGPYFHKVEDSVLISKPIYSWKKLKKNAYWSNMKNIISDDISFLKFKLFGNARKAIKNEALISDFIASKLKNIEKELGIKTYILNLPWDKEQVKIDFDNVIKTNDLFQNAKKDFDNQFYFMENSIVVDKHPNSKAHQLLAERIIRTISEN